MLFDADDDLKVIERVKHAPIPPPSRYNHEVPRDLDTVVMTALERALARRWQAAAMRTALVNVANELQTSVTNAQVIEWIGWAFTQQPGEERSGVTALIKLLEQPSKTTKSRGLSTPRSGAAISHPSARQGAGRSIRYGCSCSRSPSALRSRSTAGACRTS